MEFNPRLPLIISLAAGLALAASDARTEVYRWVDDEGKVHYSETLPPDFEDKGHDVLSERGIVLDEDQKLTPEVKEEAPKEEELPELPRDASGMQRPKALYSEQEMQRRMDAFLMLRYDSEQEILDAMDVEIKQLNYDRRLLETTRSSMEQSYRGQIKEAAYRQRAGLQVEDSMASEIASLHNRLSDNDSSLRSLVVREEGIRADFQKQLDRYRYLVETYNEESAEG